MRTKAERSGLRPQNAPPVVRDVVRSHGDQLDPVTRASMEARFEHDFGRVRVHHGHDAAAAANAIGAHAYALGEHIVFGRGAYDPASSEGRRLLGHELTHVVQQQGRPARGVLTVSAAGATEEREAMAAGEALVNTSGLVHATEGACSSVVQLEPEPEESETAESEGGEDVHDGDSPVIAVPEPPGAEESTVLAEAEPTPGEGLGDVFAAKGGPGPKPSKAKPAKPKPPPNSITKIDVDLSAQEMTVTWKDGTVEKRNISSGKGRRGTAGDPCATQQEKNCTPTGTFEVGSIGNASTTNKHGDRMGWFVGLKGDSGPEGDASTRGIGIHNTQPVPGEPASHGCIRVGTGADAMAFAKKVNKGVVRGETVITVSGKAPTKPYGAPKKKGTKKP